MRFAGLLRGRLMGADESNDELGPEALGEENRVVNHMWVHRVVLASQVGLIVAIE